MHPAVLRPLLAVTFMHTPFGGSGVVRCPANNCVVDGIPGGGAVICCSTAQLSAHRMGKGSRRNPRVASGPRMATRPSPWPLRYCAEKGVNSKLRDYVRVVFAIEREYKGATRGGHRV